MGLETTAKQAKAGFLFKSLKTPIIRVISAKSEHFKTYAYCTTKSANKALHKTQPARRSFHIIARYSGFVLGAWFVLPATALDVLVNAGVNAGKTLTHACSCSMTRIVAMNGNGITTMFQ